MTSQSGGFKIGDLAIKLAAFADDATFSLKISNL